MISDGDHEASTALRAALVQWRKRLQAIARLLLKSDMDPPHPRALETDDNEIFWLSCHFQTPGDLEAAKLFALLARADYALWKEFLRDIWLDEISWIAFFERCASLRVGVKLVVDDDERDVREYCESVVDALHTKRSGKYKRTRALLERVMGAPLPVVPLQLACSVDDDGREEGGSDSKEDHDSGSDVYGRVCLSRCVRRARELTQRHRYDLETAPFRHAQNCESRHIRCRAWDAHDERSTLRSGLSGLLQSSVG